MFFTSLLQALALLATVTSAQSATACNNSPSLCSRAYNNITHLGAHDSPFLRDESTSFSTSGNQYLNSTIQLDAGVRMLTVQVHKTDKTGADKWRLCHTNCDLLDAGNLVSWLSAIKTWLDANKNEVVTILLVNSDSASAADFGAQFESSGVDKYAYTPANTTTIPDKWPTLQSLISNGTRLMAFIAALPQTSTTYPYLMNQFDFMFENTFENENPANYSCNPSRPGTLTPAQAKDSGRMFLMNHFLYDTQFLGIQQPNETYANVTNAETGLGSLGSRISNCTGVYNKPPTFVITDFFNVGPAIKSVDKANGVSNPVGRRQVTDQPPDQSLGSAGVRMGGSLGAVVIAMGVAVAFGL